MVTSSVAELGLKGVKVTARMYSPGAASFSSNFKNKSLLRPLAPPA